MFHKKLKPVPRARTSSRIPQARNAQAGREYCSPDAAYVHEGLVVAAKEQVVARGGRQVSLDFSGSRPSRMIGAFLVHIIVVPLPNPAQFDLGICVWRTIPDLSWVLAWMHPFL